jgi:hypothetical protein
MDQNKSIKTWVTPELIVIVRNKPEEAVLWHCKTEAKSGPEGYNSLCLATYAFCGLMCDYSSGS